jgi:hypothetical protein
MPGQAQFASKKTVPHISASPNPVPTGIGFGTTTVTWSTGDGQPGEVYVDIGGEPEKLFGEGATGTLPAAWIGRRSTYVFRLYRAGDRSKPLALVVVAAQTDELPRARPTDALPRASPVPATGVPLLSASPNPAPRTAGFSKTVVRWSTGDNSEGEVYVSANGGPEERFAQGAAGTNEAAWIGKGSYTFRLYAGTTHETVLATLLVQREGEKA